jgi:CO/xanthine dehydrogenase Mo-binding subunit
LIVGFSLAGAGLAGRASAAGAFPVVDPGRLDSWLSIDASGKVTVRSGRVDQGQGKATAFGQIVAEELDVRFDQVHVVLGDTGITPNQGKSTATDGIRQGAPPLRNAAAQARATLLGLASAKLGVPASQLTVSEGVVSAPNGSKATYGELIGGKLFNVTMTVTGPTAYNGQSVNMNVVPTVPVKDPAKYRIVGTSVPRVDIPAKVAGSYTYTQNIAVPGMVHARMVLPPQVASYPRMVPQLLSARFTSKPPEGVQLFVKGNFVAVVADDEWKAIQARTMVETKWADDPATKNLGSYSSSLRSSPNNEFNLADSVTVRGNVDAAFAAAGSKTVTARYDYPQQIHGLIGPSVALASYDRSKGSLLIWAGSQNLVQTRADVAQMLGMSLDDIRVLYTEQASQFGRGGVDDVAPAAALLSKELGKPVRVQWMRQDEHAWSPHQPGRTHDLKGAVDASGRISAWQEESWGIRARWDQGWPLPWLLLGTAKPVDAGSSGATGTPSYVIANQRNVSHSVDPMTRPMYMRTVAGTQQTFIQESFMDELAAAAGADPIEFRIKHLDPAAATTPRSLLVLREVQRRSGWETRPSPAGGGSGSIVRGRGFALSPSASCCVANVAEVEVNKRTGAVRVTGFWSAAELGTTLVNPDGVKMQLEGGSIMGLSRSLKEETRFGRHSVRSLDWVTYPILRFADMPRVFDTVVLTSPPSIPGGGIGEPASIAVPAAVGNAIFDAVGVRMRSIPFTPPRVRAALKAAGT